MPRSVRSTIPRGRANSTSIGDDLRQPDGHGQGRDLDRPGTSAIAIDDQPAQAVAFAEDQPGRPLRDRRSRAAVRSRRAAASRRRQNASSSGLGRVPGVQADADPAAAVEDAPGDELALVGEQTRPRRRRPGCPRRDPRPNRAPRDAGRRTAAPCAVSGQLGPKRSLARRGSVRRTKHAKSNRPPGLPQAVSDVTDGAAAARENRPKMPPSDFAFAPGHAIIPAGLDLGGAKPSRPSQSTPPCEAAGEHLQTM